ncbi:MAG: polyphosphate kinase 1 [Ignavibacteriae bacterium]|nr:polyphosphate kinase 1 [Ignavibacteriota bacterium]
MLLKNRDLSWLAFNHRVLQEAADPTVPLYERIKFLAIWSSNLDEFFRVRVASLRAIQRLKKKTKKKLDLDPDKLLKRLLKSVALQQEEFGSVFRDSIKKELSRQGIFLVRESELNEEQREFVCAYFRQHVADKLRPIVLSGDQPPPFLHNRSLYLVARFEPAASGDSGDDCYGLVEIPSSLARFLILPASEGHHAIMFLDDVIRVHLATVFAGYRCNVAYSIKLTRDAELEIDDEMTGDLVEKVKKALRKRGEGLPCRFLSDSEMPKSMLIFLLRHFGLSNDDVVVGSRYHNFSDFFSFPNPKEPALTYEPMAPIPLAGLDGGMMMEKMRMRDFLAHFPFHSYDCVIRFLHEAADDPNVDAISITLYRVAKNSIVAQELMRAARQGKRVTAFIEVKARFDEESNIRWAEEMEKAGVRVLYSIPNLKVHAKLCLVEKRKSENAGVGESEKRLYAYLSTGNFNESAARLYTDFGFFTSDERITSEVEKVFQILCRERRKAKFEHLLVARNDMREMFEALVEREMKNARKGKDAFIIAKMNSLEDAAMIEKLYEASEAVVKIQLIVRGICCLIPGIKGMSENISVMSIIDRFLEHARLFVFCNGGDELFYLSSADWMKRNLDRRIEVAFPIYDKSLQQQLRTILDLQLNDNVKARVITKRLDNPMRKDDGGPLRSQYASYAYWEAPT